MSLNTAHPSWQSLTRAPYRVLDAVPLSLAKPQTQDQKLVMSTWMWRRHKAARSQTWPILVAPAIKPDLRGTATVGFNISLQLHQPFDRVATDIPRQSRIYQHSGASGESTSPLAVAHLGCQRFQRGRRHGCASCARVSAHHSMLSTCNAIAYADIESPRRFSTSRLTPEPNRLPVFESLVLLISSTC